nr:putative ribonuclease H-like domain-containing protein [Tanacetum cinerariifolium]
MSSHKVKSQHIFRSQDKYVAEILKKFDFLSVKTASTPIETKKPLVKDEEAANVDVHLYRSIIGSLMYLTASRHDIMYAVCSCSRFQVTPKTSHLQTVKTIFRYLKGQPKLGLWYLRESAFDLEAYSDSYYAGADLDKKSIIRGSFKCWLITTPQMVINSPCLIDKKEMAIPGQTATGKELSNSLMAGSLPKTTLPTKLTSAKVKTINDEVKIQAIVNEKRVNIKERSIRRTLRLDDAEEAGVPFFMFPRFVQLIINHQLVDMDYHKEIFDTPSLTKKVFANMKRVGTGFSREVTLLFDNMLVQAPEAVVKAAKLMTKVVTTTEATKVSVLRKRRGVIIQDPEETTTTATVQPKVQAKDKRKAILIEEPKPLKRKAQIKLDKEMKPLTQAQARRNTIVYLKNMVGFKMDYFKGMTYDKIKPLFEKHYNYNQAFLDEVNEGVKVSKTEIVTDDDDDDDVYTNATPLASKIPIVDYKIHTGRNRPYFKIIRVDGNHMLFISLSTMLKNFDREDLESLWKIVRDGFEKTKPKNYSDDYMLNTLKIMFEKPNFEASVWKDQKGRYGLSKVKSWKLIESCRIHCITFLTTHIFLLVERMYPLTHFTLEQMLNDVRLQVEDESEMSLELLRLVKRHLNEGTASTSVSTGLQIKQMEDGIFLNQSKYIKEMLKKFGLEDFKPTKTSMSMKIKLTKDDDADSVDSSKYQGTRIETIVYADSDHAGDYIDLKRTSGVCMFMGCCLTSWFAKKQTAIAISMTEAEYFSAGKACQQALWMKQTLINYGIRLDNVLIMFTFHEHVMDPLDILRNPGKEKGKKVVSSSVISSSSSSSNDNEAPCFLEFYYELSDSEDLTKTQREKRGMFKCLNRYVGTITSEEQPNKRTPSPPLKIKSLSPPQAPSKSISSKSTHYTSSSSPSESPMPTHVSPPPKLCFVIPIKQEPLELPPLQMSLNHPYAQIIDNWTPGPSNPSPPPRVSRPPLGFLNLPPGFEPLPSTQPLFVNINNNTPLLNNNVPPLENFHHPPPNHGN